MCGNEPYVKQTDAALRLRVHTCVLYAAADTNRQPECIFHVCHASCGGLLFSLLLLQALVESVHRAFGPLLERRFRLEGARCVLALADSMEARVAYFGPVAAAAATVAAAGAGSGAAGVTAGATPGTPGTPGGGGSGAGASAFAAAAAVAASATPALPQQQPSGGRAPGTPGGGGAGAGGGGGGGVPTPLQGVLGPLMDTLLLDVVSREGPGGWTRGMGGWSGREGGRPGRGSEQASASWLACA